MKTFGKIFVVAGLFALAFILVSSYYAIVFDSSFSTAAGVIGPYLPVVALGIGVLYLLTWLTTPDGLRVIKAMVAEGKMSLGPSHPDDVGDADELVIEMLDATNDDRRRVAERILLFRGASIFDLITVITAVSDHDIRERAWQRLLANNPPDDILTRYVGEIGGMSERVIAELSARHPERDTGYLPALN